MRRYALIICLVFLLVGMAIGGAIIYANARLGRVLIGLLADEVKASCNCELVYRGVQLQLFRNRAVASNVRITENGKTTVKFERLVAEFDLSEIFQGKVFLAPLRLIEGELNGVGPESTIAKVVDYMAAPLPEGQQNKPKIKLKLRALEVERTKLDEHFKNYTLSGDSLKLRLTRTPNNEFDLNASLGRLKLDPVSKSSGEKEIFFGGIKASLFLGDDTILLHDFFLGTQKSFGRLTGSIVNDQSLALSGKGNYRLDLGSNPWTNLISGVLKGKIDTSGTLLSPVLNTNLESESLFLNVGDQIFPVNIKEGALQCRLDNKDAAESVPQCSLWPFSADIASASVSLTENWKVSSHRSKISGSIKSEQFKWDKFSFGGVNLSWSLDPAASSPLLSVDGLISAMAFDDIQLGKVNLLGMTSIGSKAQAELTASLFPPSGGSVDLATTAALKNDTWELGNSSIAASKIGFGAGSEGKFFASGNINLGRDGTGVGAVQLHDEKASILASGDLRVDKKGLSLQGSDVSKALIYSVQLPAASDGDNIIKMELKGPPLGTLQEMCPKINGTLEYHFNRKTPLQGKGNIALKKAAIGCEATQISLDTPPVIAITDGVLPIKGVILRGPHTALSLGGNISFKDGFQAQANGSLSLDSLVGLFPGIDDLQGQIVVNSTLSGALSTPQLTGRASIEGVELAFEGLGLAINHLHGNIELIGKSLVLENLEGAMNGGRINAKGSYNLQSTKGLELDANLQGVLVEPEPQVSVLLSGKVALRDQILSGEISIDNAEIERQLSLSALVRKIPSLLGIGRPSNVTSSRGVEGLTLDLAVRGSRSVFVRTPFGSAELDSNIHIWGSGEAPRIEGTLNVASGNLQIKDKRFEITQGIIFLGGESTVALVAETYARSRTGESVLIILEAEGPLNNPRLRFTSDRGLSEPEILNLLTSSGAILPSARESTLALDAGSFSLPTPDEERFYLLNRFIHNLTTIDSIALEPSFNPRRGAIDPTVTARKKLFPRLSLLAQSSLGSTSQDQRLELLYDLQRNLSLSFYVEDESTRKNSAVGADLTYTIWAEQPPTLELSAKGNEIFSEEDIYKILRLGPSSRLRAEEVSALPARLQEAYEKEGFLNAKIKVWCSEIGQGLAPISKSEKPGAKPQFFASFCKLLSLEIVEGQQFEISELKIEGAENLPFLLEQKVKLSKHSPASTKSLQRLSRAALRALRNEGYIAARVVGTYTPSANKSGPIAVLQVEPGEPVTFTFVGNKVFSAKEFLDTINLFGRKQPFGNNTISILVQNIERKYREAGYLLASVSYEIEVDPETRRKNFTITILEETPVRVSKVRLEGMQTIDKDFIEDHLSSQQEEMLFEPSVALEEQIEQNAQVLSDLMVGEGFPQATIETAIEPLEDKNGKGESAVEIVYRIQEGPRVKGKLINVSGLPSDIETPKLPQEPYTIAQASAYLQALLESLKNAGYVAPRLSTSQNGANSLLEVHAEPGLRAYISEIEIVGNSNIEDKVIMMALGLEKGNPWESAAIDQARRRLLRLGLFSRVELEPQDGSLDSASEILLVRVEERTLRSLELGTGANSEFGLHLFGFANDRRLFRDGRSLSLRLDTYYDRVATDISQGVASLSYSDPFFYGSNYSSLSDLRFQRLALASFPFDLDRVSLANYLNRTWDDNLNLSFGQTYMREDLNDVAADAIVGPLDSGMVDISFLSATFSYDSRDYPLNPRSGYFLGLDGTLASEAVGSDANYGGGGAHGSYLIPISDRFTLASNAKVASLWTFGGTSTIPISQRYYLGGRTTVRGFKENQLGPRGEEGSVLGGDLLVLGNLEFRYLVVGDVSLHLFLDGGSVFLKNRSVTADELRYSSGIGVAYLSPLGPIGLDFGRPFDRRPDEPDYRIHFTVGTIF